MEWLLKGAVLWLSLDLALISTIWYVSVTVSQLWPDWWQNVIAETVEPDFPL